MAQLVEDRRGVLRRDHARHPGEDHVPLRLLEGEHFRHVVAALLHGAEVVHPHEAFVELPRLGRDVRLGGVQHNRPFLPRTPS